MPRSLQHITILHAGPGHLSFVRGEETGAVVAQAAETGPWSIEDGSLATALREFAGRHKLGEDRIFVVLPRHEAAVRILELPSQDPVELQGMVHLGAEEIVPFPLDELQTSYCFLEKLDGGSSRVLAVVVRKAVVEAYLDVLREAGLGFEQVFLSTACMLTALKRYEAGSSAAVHVGPDGLEVAILCDGRMTFGRGVAISVVTERGHLTDASQEEITAEVRSSLSASRRESVDGSSPAELLVSVSGVEAKPVADMLQAAVGMPAHAFKQDGVASLVDAGALATARGDRSHFIALLPESELNRRAASVSRARGLRVLAAAAIAVIATVAVYAEMVMQRRSYLAELDTRADALRPTAQTLRTKRQQLHLIEDQVKRTASPIALLSTIASLAPNEGINFTRFTYDQKQGVTVNGRAMDPKLFEKLIDGMRGSGAASLSMMANAVEMYRQEDFEFGNKVWNFGVSIPFTAQAPANE